MFLGNFYAKLNAKPNNRLLYHVGRCVFRRVVSRSGSNPVHILHRHELSVSDFYALSSADVAMLRRDLCAIPDVDSTRVSFIRDILSSRQVDPVI